MRATSVFLGMIVVGTFLVATTPTASAVGFCVTKVKESVPTDDCDGLVCLGYNSQTGWQTCVPPEIYCLYQTDCCTTGTDFYCPEPW